MTEYKNRKGYEAKRTTRVRNGRKETTTVWVRTETAPQPPQKPAVSTVRHATPTPKPATTSSLTIVASPPKALPEKNYPRNTLLAGVVGSQAYHLATPTSDYDILGIYQEPTETFLGLPADANKSKYTKTTTGNPTLPDSTFHEIGKYVKLAMQNNPTALELLWLDEYTKGSPFGEQLVKNRRKFLIAHQVFQAYTGYAVSETKKIWASFSMFSPPAELTRVNKRGRHTIRLLLQAEHALRHGDILVNMENHQKEIFEAGELAANDTHTFMEQVEEQVAKVENAFKHSKLPTEHTTKTRDLFNNLIVEQRIRTLKR